jgi:5-methylcytosine-specific restriction endonuclease McrA
VDSKEFTMKNYTKLYLDFFGYDVSDFICCEMCGQKAVDINHIQPRGMGGSKLKDNIENLMAMCRKCHIDLADRKKYKELLETTHMDFIEKMGKRKNL